MHVDKTDAARVDALLGGACCCTYSSVSFSEHQPATANAHVDLRTKTIDYCSGATFQLQVFLLTEVWSSSCRHSTDVTNSSAYTAHPFNVEQSRTEFLLKGSGGKTTAAAATLRCFIHVRFTYINKYAETFMLAEVARRIYSIGQNKGRPSTTSTALNCLVQYFHRLHPGRTRAAYGMCLTLLPAGCVSPEHGTPLCD